MFCFRCKCSQPTLHSAIVLARRYTASEAESAGLIDQVCSYQELKKNAIKAANKLTGSGLDRPTLTTIKRDLYCGIYQLLNEPCYFVSKL